MGVHKRRWKTAKGETKEVFVADYSTIDTSTGKRTRHIKTCKTRKAAVAYLAKTTVAISDGRHVPDRASITVAEAADIWIKAVELGRGDNPPAEQSTLRQYRSHLKHHILPAIGKVKLSQLTRANVSALRDQLLT